MPTKSTACLVNAKSSAGNSGHASPKISFNSGGLLVHVGMRAAGGGRVRGAVRVRILRLEVEHHADLVPAMCAVGLDAGAAGAHQVVRGDRRLELVAVARRQRAMQ